MHDSLVVAFRGIPEGVTVKPSPMGTGMPLDPADPVGYAFSSSSGTPI